MSYSDFFLSSSICIYGMITYIQCKCKFSVFQTTVWGSEMNVVLVHSLTKWWHQGLVGRGTSQGPISFRICPPNQTETWNLSGRIQSIIRGHVGATWRIQCRTLRSGVHQSGTDAAVCALPFPPLLYTQYVNFWFNQTIGCHYLWTGKLDQIMICSSILEDLLKSSFSDSNFNSWFHWKTSFIFSFS